MAKIGILYICTGKYSIFWKDFYKSSEEKFLIDHEKHYFVFTDDQSIQETEHIHVTPSSPRGFPMDSLLRFEMFLSIENQLKEMDYLYFLNANMLFVDNVNQEIFPSDEQNGLMGVLHPGYFKTNIKHYTYERNKKSTAYIAYNEKEDYHYFMGGFNGGKTKNFLELCLICNDNTRIDTENNIMAIYHDESHLNHYFHNKKILILGPDYGFPEDAKLQFQPKVIIRNKVKQGKYFDKLPRKSYFLRLKLKLKRLYAAYTWK